MNPTTSADHDEFVHPALLYRTDAEYLDLLVPFISDGLAAGDPVAVIVPGPRLRQLDAALGVSAERVHRIDMTVAGRNPGRIIPSVLHFADTHPGRHVRIVGEPVWPGRSATEYPACAQHEALVNTSFAGRDITIACPYDAAGLDPGTIADARATHPLVWEADQRYSSAEYAPDRVVARYNEPLHHSPADAHRHLIAAPTDLRPARRAIADRARALGLPAHRVADLELIATELATNSLVHADGPCELRVWSDGRDIVCEGRDTGRLTDPLAGRRPAKPSDNSGRGLLMINDLADLVRTHTSPQGTTIRAYLRVR